mgnify:CR=1 FL=1
MREFEVGDMVATKKGWFVGMVFWKGVPPSTVTYPGTKWYKVLWNDGDITEEDGVDMRHYKEDEYHGKKQRRKGYKEGSQRSNDEVAC